jgi:glutamate N-acetyltransferase/amino-acid N-acetyltransferase
MGAMTDPSALAPVAGFRLAGVPAGIKKKSDALDLGAIVADEVVPAAAVITRNLLKAAPVLVAAERLKKLRARAVLVNAGNANAATGPAGDRACRRTTAIFAEALGCDEREVLPCSTGVIGHVLPVGPFESGVPALVEALRPDGAGDFAKAILTTDAGPKVARRTFRVGRREHQVLAIAKGAGMIHPDMATTLGFAITDAAVDGRVLRELLREATDLTFNRISVDGDTSTNDIIVAMASGAGGGEPVTGRGARAFARGLREALGDVAQMIVADGEGAQHVARITIEGLVTDSDALKIARTVATSALVKTAMHGGDPNWGRLLAAAGRAGVRFDPAAASVWIGDVPIFRRGRTLLDAETEVRAAVVMSEPRYTIRLRLGNGKGTAYYDTCDLGHDYVTLNADYRT